MGYYPDLRKISIDEFRGMLSCADLIPSWMILKENIDSNLDKIKKHHIHNLQELKEALKSKSDVIELAKNIGLSEKYLTVLRRVVNGYHPKPNRMMAFPDLSAKTVTTLEKMGIKNTRQLFDKIKTGSQRDKLSQETGIDQETTLQLAKLADLSRIRWVNHTFTHVLCEVGYDSAEKVAHADPSELYQKVKDLNAEKRYYNAHIGIKDMQRLVEGAKLVPLEVQY